MPDVEALYQGRRVLVLGGTGFIGWNLIGRLLQVGAEVTAFARNHSLVWDPRPTHGSPMLVTGDLNDPEAIELAVQDKSVIFNVAGRSGALSSNRHPVDDLEANCRGVLHVLDACRKLNPEARIVFAGSRLQYGQPRYLPVDEAHPTDPLCIYGIHKLTGEKYHLLYHRLYGLPTTVLRISNPYGPSPINHQIRYNIVNHFTRQALRDGPLQVFGDGQQLRDYLYIGDLVEALLVAGTHPQAPGRAFNVGSGQPIAFVEMAQAITRIMAGGWIEQVPWPTEHQAVETGDFYLDVNHIKDTLGWSPHTDLETGIEKTAQSLRQIVSDQGN